MIAYSRGGSIKDNSPQQRTASDFDAFADALDRDRAPTKEAAGFVCGPLCGNGRRCKENVQERNWIAFDLDKIASDRLGEVRAWFEGRGLGVGWATHSSKPEAPRERFILALDSDVGRDLGMSLGKVMTAALTADFGADVEVDPCCFRGEQPIYLPPTGVEVRRFGVAPLSVPKLTDEAQMNYGIPSSDFHPAFIWPSSVSEAIERTRPTGPGERQRQLFQFARTVKALWPTATRDSLRSTLQDWHAAALPYITTKDFAITQHDFWRAWSKVKVPVGSTGLTLNTAIERARSLQPPDGVQRLGYGDFCKRLVTICIALQEHFDTEPFFLSARMAGHLLGINRYDANTLLRTLVTDGVLELTHAGNAHRAARYRFVWAEPPCVKV